jgi:hypothetical protein
MATLTEMIDATMVDRVPRRRIVIASMVGTTIEFYDFYIYATAAVSIFPHLFFPKGNPTTALLASLATFGLAFVARPVGSILFGHFGDRAGRKATLVGSLLTMGIATFVIGLLPTYQQVGVAAPVLLAVLRFAQGLALGGEWSGAALLATETAEADKRGRAGMWPQLGAPFGFLLANGLFLILIGWLGHSTAGADLAGPFLTWGWRIPFLLSAVMVAIGAVCEAATDGDARVCQGTRAWRASPDPADCRIPQQLARIDHRHVRDARDLHALLHGCYVGTELRHSQAIPGRDRSGLRLCGLPALSVDRGVVPCRNGAHSGRARRPIRPTPNVVGRDRGDRPLRCLV